MQDELLRHFTLARACPVAVPVPPAQVWCFDYPAAVRCVVSFHGRQTSFLCVVPVQDLHLQVRGRHDLHHRSAGLREHEQAAYMEQGYTAVQTNGL